MNYFNNDKITHKIISFALLEIEKHGISGMNIRRICLHANVGKTTFYNKFTNKENLLENLNLYLKFRIKEMLFSNWDETASIDESWLKIATSTWALCLNFKSTVIAGQYIKEYFHQKDQEIDLIELSSWFNILKKEKEAGNIIDLPISVLNRMTLGTIISIAVDAAKKDSEDITEKEFNLLISTLLKQIKINK